MAEGTMTGCRRHVTDMADISRGRHPLRGHRAAAGGIARMTVLCDVIVAATFTISTGHHRIARRTRVRRRSFHITPGTYRGATSIHAAAWRRLFSTDYMRNVGDTRTHAAPADVMPYLTTAVGTGFAKPRPCAQRCPTVASHYVTWSLDRI